eukprot:scaffold34302_cov63-Phaeocystis_antarctica.AAC.2
MRWANSRKTRRAKSQGCFWIPRAGSCPESAYLGVPRLKFEATLSAIFGPPSPWLWALLPLSVLLVAGVVLFVLCYRRFSRDRANMDLQIPQGGNTGTDRDVRLRITARPTACQAAVHIPLLRHRRHRSHRARRPVGVLPASRWPSRRRLHLARQAVA